MAFAVHGEKHFIEVPFVARAGTPATELIGVLLPELLTPFADGFVRDEHAADKQEFFHVTMAERESVVKPDRMADDLTRKPVVLV